MSHTCRHIPEAAQVRARLLTGGYTKAYERFLAATAVRDPDAVFFALFEALDWAHAIDDLIALTWSPRGKVMGYGWRRDPAIGGGDQLSDIMSGLRYVRNRVHHQWADALVTDEGLTLPVVLPATFSAYVWRPACDLPTPPNEGREAGSDSVCDGSCRTHGRQRFGGDGSSVRVHRAASRSADSAPSRPRTILDLEDACGVLDSLPNLAKPLAKADPELRRRVYEAFHFAVELDRNKPQVRLKALISSAFSTTSDLDDFAGMVANKAIAGAGFEPATFGL
jgi:hypothetical protein